MSEQLVLILVYDEDSDNFFPLKPGEKPDTEKNTHLIIDEPSRKITLSFTPNSSLIEKRTVERRVASFIKTGYEVPGAKGLRIGAGFPLEKVDPKSGELPEILLTHGHTFGKQKLVHDGVPDYVEKEDNYEVEEGSAAINTDVLGSKISMSTIKNTKSESKLPDSMKQRLEEAFGKPSPTGSSQDLSEPAQKETSSNVQEGVNITPTDEHLFILGQFVDMYLQQGFQVLVYKNSQGNYEFKTLKEDSKYFIDGNQLFKT